MWFRFLSVVFISKNGNLHRTHTHTEKSINICWNYYFSIFWHPRYNNNNIACSTVRSTYKNHHRIEKKKLLFLLLFVVIEMLYRYTRYRITNLKYKTLMGSLASVHIIEMISGSTKIITYFFPPIMYWYVNTNV